MIQQWGDTKRLIFEDIVVYIISLILSVSWDFWHNLLITTGVSSGELNPVRIGTIQIIAISFLSLQLIRRFIWWQYYE